MFAGWGIARIARTALNDKIAHRAIEERAVEMAFAGKADKLVAMARRVVEKHGGDVAFVCMYNYAVCLSLGVCER